MAKSKTKYFLNERQMANLVLAARGESDCPAAMQEIKKIDKKFHLRR